MTSLLVMQSDHMLLVGAIRFEGRFCSSTKGRIVGGGHSNDMPCTLQLSSMTLVGTG